MSVKFKGEYVAGFGKGAFFVGLDGYKFRIREKLGFTPFPGTLNLRVGGEVVELLRKLKFIELSSFEQDGKKFGSCKLRPAVVGGLPAYLVVPQKNKHPPNILEFISLFELRKELKLEPSDKVEFEL